MKYFKSILIVTLTIVCCSRDQQMEYEDYFKVKAEGKRNISIAQIKLDTIRLEHINTSYTGQLQISDSALYFIDSRFCWVYVFDANGNLLLRKLGQGNGPGEVPVSYIEAFCFLPKNEKLILGSTSDYYLINSQWELESTNVLKLDYNTVRVDPMDPATYTYAFNLFVHPDSKGNIYVPIHAESEQFNFCQRPYYTESRILLKIDYDSNIVKEVIGRRSPEYLNYNFLGHHSFFNFDIDNKDNFYISHEIDSLIYIYNSDFRPVKAFGSKGKNMNTDYKELPTLDIKKFRDLYFNDRPNRGYYTWIRYFSDRDLLFRSYKKNSSTPYDGLQIYKDDTLIGDIDVPKNFNVIGYINPYFYSCAYIDEVNEEIKVYRFKISL